MNTTRKKWKETVEERASACATDIKKSTDSMNNSLKGTFGNAVQSAYSKNQQAPKKAIT
ncbi:hypothetical protein [Parascardovia denticolens]|uniref:hypothetical protein n=1 Tax=Parascardovia denticolens TaxID=78258 RepID=UPI0001D09F2F|nr:hypothetical protein [Parascardovia denticolens]EFG33257.1 hypothetical protein HMPREF9017_00669 [Parascardovia denticolens F0305]